MSRLTTGLYYGVQKLRGGVTPEMVRRASALLERPWSEVRQYIEDRIELNYGLHGRGGGE